MQTYLLMAGFFITMLFFFIDKNLFSGTSVAKKHMLGRFEKNKKRQQKLQAEFEKLVSSHNAWSKKAFPDNDITYSEYIGLLKEKSNIEYSDTEFEKLRMRLNPKQVIDYIEKLNNQEEAVIALQHNLDGQKKMLQTLSSAKAS